ncbi:hypothetical protein [Polymorphobacter fuscus]|uniref:Phage baseplate protein n=1 Tax=Sandarakinorhabdus fusca TaxID=1439888 RepID=A0A7C9KHZ7_9SPHN|nr:hypothetical protein [Polymorphobacter fuscus]KAB7647952.1 hypothetical protein F9290_08380 [Polymorphobacter fuscus]MQT17280.1 hypothetical protein [Polymorphobacter fuscus]NJC08723.1 hypothetical protein [Polymorphobacter fuscus]
MPTTMPATMAAPGEAAMLDLWEAGSGASLTRRGLHLLAAALPDTHGLANLSIGARDAELLALHDRLFGPAIACRTDCAACGAPIELAFATDDIRADAALRDTVDVVVGDTRIRARLLDSRDLLAIEAESDPTTAERRLLERCIVTAEHAGTPVAPAEVPAAAMDAVGAALAAADPQAEILLDIACADCAATALAPFDIVGHVWARLDHWARAMLGAVDSLARSYGWSEAAILALGPVRRQAYLDRIAGAA